MSVVGIDFGLQTCLVAIKHDDGHIEVIENEFGHRNTPTNIRFTKRNRLIGTTDSDLGPNANTILQWKNFIGHIHDDFEREKELMLCGIEESDNSVKFKVDCCEQAFTTDQVTAMMFTKLKDIAEPYCDITNFNCVISVPMYFTHIQREVLLNASKIAELNCLQLLNDTTAVALFYYMDQKLSSKKGSQRTVFVDMGASSLQVSAVEFSQDKIQVVATAYDKRVGGRYFDQVLANHFRNKIGKDIKEKEYIGLMAACEKLKKRMSDSKQDIPLKLFQEEEEHQMKRSGFEKLSEGLLERVKKTFNDLLDELGNRTVGEVQLVGGSTRMPAIRTIIQNVFNMRPKTTLNKDEAVALGCAHWCENLSKNCNLDIYPIIADKQPDKIQLKSGIHAESRDWKEREIFPLEISLPYVWTIEQHMPFLLQFWYINNEESRILGLNKEIGISDQQTNLKLVCVKFHLNQNGIFEIEAYETETDDTTTSEIHIKNRLEQTSKCARKRPIMVKDAIRDWKSIVEKKNIERKLIQEDKYDERRSDLLNDILKCIHQIKHKDAMSDDWIRQQEQQVEQWLDGNDDDKDLSEFQERLDELRNLLEPTSKFAQIQPIMVKDAISDRKSICEQKDIEKLEQQCQADSLQVRAGVILDNSNNEVETSFIELPSTPHSEKWQSIEQAVSAIPHQNSGYDPTTTQDTRINSRIQNAETVDIEPNNGNQHSQTASFSEVTNNLPYLPPLSLPKPNYNRHSNPNNYNHPKGRNKSPSHRYESERAFETPRDAGLNVDTASKGGLTNPNTPLSRNFGPTEKQTRKMPHTFQGQQPQTKKQKKERQNYLTGANYRPNNLDLNSPDDRKQIEEYVTPSRSTEKRIQQFQHSKGANDRSQNVDMHINFDQNKPGISRPNYPNQNVGEQAYHYQDKTGIYRPANSEVIEDLKEQENPISNVVDSQDNKHEQSKCCCLMTNVVDSQDNEHEQSKSWFYTFCCFR